MVWRPNDLLESNSPKLELLIQRGGNGFEAPTEENESMRSFSPQIQTLPSLSLPLSTFRSRLSNISSSSSPLCSLIFFRRRIQLSLFLLTAAEPGRRAGTHDRRLRVRD
ncbi:hypothetical protein ACLOJK_030425 [Asimina triloba]